MKMHKTILIMVMSLLLVCGGAFMALAEEEEVKEKVEAEAKAEE